MRSGFTVIETVIVMGLVAIIVAFLIPGIANRRAYQQEQFFWNQLRQDWRSAQLRARTERVTTVIRYDQATNQINFVSSGTYDSLDVPSTLKVVRFVPFSMHENGYVKPQTQEFCSTLTKRRYLMRIQLAWGGYHIEKVDEK